YRIAHQPSPDATLLNRSLSAGIGKVLERAMAKEAADRFSSCLTFVDALTEACAATPGWYALPRGMSQTLPTLGDTPQPVQAIRHERQSPEPVAPAPAAPPVAAPSTEEPVWVPTLPPPRVEAPKPAAIPASGNAPVGGGRGGFITGADPSQPETLEFPGSSQPAWLRDVAEEERREKQARRRGAWVALLSFLAVAGLFGAAYFGVAGITVPGVTRESAAVDSEPAPGKPSSTEGEPASSSSTESSGAAATEAVPEAENPNTGTPASESSTPEAGNPGAPPPAQPAPTAAVPHRTEAAKPKGPERPATRTAPVRFMSDPPGASVTVDAEAQYRCDTPCSLDLPLGRHTYSMRLTGYRNEIKLIDLKETGETVSIKLERRVGMVRLTSNPTGASIYVNGERQQGVTPLTLRLLPGNYRVSIEKDGRRVERNVAVSEDSAVQISADLQ
ncbi:MAG: PEGA domain-containing protein, partial [Bryobacterales bacterium]|nr:PEGA domain-containing protein [Bryobacterales bacterium]